MNALPIVVRWLVFGQGLGVGERLRAAACDLLDGVRSDSRAPRR